MLHGDGGRLIAEFRPTLAPQSICRSGGPPRWRLEVLPIGIRYADSGSGTDPVIGRMGIYRQERQSRGPARSAVGQRAPHTKASASQEWKRIAYDPAFAHYRAPCTKMANEGNPAGMCPRCRLRRASPRPSRCTPYLRPAAARSVRTRRSWP